jgi:Tol biopolymer transport system component
MRSQIYECSRENRFLFTANPPSSDTRFCRKLTLIVFQKMGRRSFSPKVPTDWSPDGRFVLFTQTDTNGAGDLWAMPMNANQHPYPLTQTRFDEHDASFSPDGRWITYSSDESGKTEVYVAPFSTTRQISDFFGRRTNATMEPRG